MAQEAQLILRLSHGRILAELPGYGGAARVKLDTTGVVWPAAVWMALADRQAEIEAKETAKAEADARVKAEIAARAVPIPARTALPKQTSRSLIFNETATNHGRAFAFVTIGTPRRGEREDFLARPKGSTKPWQQITTYDEAPATWCQRNGWERPKGSRNTPKLRGLQNFGNEVGI